MRQTPLPEELRAEELLAEVNARAQRLQVALTVILSLNMAVISGAVTFWVLAVRN